MTLREVLLRTGTRFRAHYLKPDEVYICCPFCAERGETADVRFRLGVNIVTGLAHCFNCGWRRRNAFSALQALWHTTGAIDKDALLPPRQKVAEGLPEDFEELANPVSFLDQEARRYVLQRGLTSAQIIAKRIGASFSGNYAYRVIFPNVVGARVAGFIARDFTNCQEPRYLFSRGPKSLYNWRVGSKKIIVTEGVFKALRIEQVTNISVVATLGSTMLPGQVGLVQDGGVQTIVVWPDPDKAGCKGCVETCELLVTAGLSVQVVWPVTEPPDEASLDTLRANLRIVQPYTWRLRNEIVLAQGGR